MLTGLDHIIIGVDDLERATSIFNDSLGLAVSGGGEHPTGGTANRIIVIGDTYLELITVRKPEEAQQSMLERMAKGNGYFNYVIASNRIHSDSEAIQQRGISVIGPYAGELKSSDGKYRGWMRTDIERSDLVQRYPFLIQHDSTGEERRFRLAGWQTPPAHPLGATRVYSVAVVVQDLEEATARYQRIFGLNPSEPFSGQEFGVDANYVSFSFSESRQRIFLIAPLSTTLEPEDAPAHLPMPGALAGYLQRLGESICYMTLEVADLTEARHYLDSHHVPYTYQAKPRPLLWIHSAHACGATIILYQQ
ncbi:glyoxalase-like protein [Thermosporothrix hazakensis]|uniref:Glyoxalase-like protein n=2 Tax=Thermosporothrix TaxID=768650 RepID=A0A326UA08_THEHA|nr:VOC family protein [Thermosporothrix hazakensis]PZW32880.1 glyoxalase-like protein [Thermosporothrix hazakensis]BBH90861.1 hypothetical protein KTC_56120 [Thermosporothrix sp. COM3]GCE48912.1 hypothetical protein KTH_37810 [Thermosporothrix hazakensis]